MSVQAKPISIPFCPLPLLSLKMLVMAFVLIISSGATTTSVSGGNGEGVCRSEVCHTWSRMLRDSMNQSADPCTDFYAFTCGAWTAKPIPDDQLLIGVGQDMEKHLQHVIETGLKQVESKTTSSKTIRFVRAHYQSCLHSIEHPSDQVGLTRLRHALELVLGEPWRMGIKHSRTTNQTKPMTWLQLLTRALNSGAGVPGPVSRVFLPLLSLRLEVGFQANPNRLQLGPGQSVIDEQSLLNPLTHQDELTTTRKVMRKLVKLLCEPAVACDRRTLTADIEAIIKLQTELVSITLPEDETEFDASRLHAITTVAELASRTNNSQWEHQFFIPMLMGLGGLSTEAEARQVINSTTLIEYHDPNYVFRAAAILERTPFRVLHNLLGLWVVITYGHQVNSKVRKLTIELEKMTALTDKQVTPAVECYNVVDQLAPWAMSRLFVENSGFSSKAKALVTSMVDQIFSTLDQRLQTNQWLDAETRDKARLKLAKMTRNIAYPEWLMNDTALDAYHGLTDETELSELLALLGGEPKQPNSHRYLEAVFRFNRVLFRRQVRSLGQPNDPDHWPFSPDSADSQNNYWQNSINILADLLQYPYFEAGNPYVMNYATAGFAISKNILFAFDRLGRQLDEQGQVVKGDSWWTDQSMGRLQNLSECFVKQYHRKTLNPISLKDKILLLERRVDDNGGLAVAHQAFLDRTTNEVQKEHSQRLVGLEHFTPEQLFFIAYGNVWCMKIRPELEAKLAQVPRFIPPIFHVNVPTMNLPAFAQAFKCPVNTPMNPVEKCSVW